MLGVEPVVSRLSVVAVGVRGPGRGGQRLDRGELLLGRGWSSGRGGNGKQAQPSLPLVTPPILSTLSGGKSKSVCSRSPDAGIPSVDIITMHLRIFGGREDTGGW